MIFEMGMRQEDSCTAKNNDGFLQAFIENGGTHMFAGHDHNNNFVADYNGVKLCYMTKSSYNCYFSSKKPSAVRLLLLTRTTMLIWKLKVFRGC